VTYAHGRSLALILIGTIVAMLASGCTILHGREHLGVPIRTVVLTFDDGPNRNLGATSELLDVLAKHKVPAAFCVVGEQVDANPDLVRRMADEGHLIVNHTETHYTPFTKMPDAIMEEFRECDMAIGRALSVEDYRSEYFRPPVGLMTFGLKSRLKDEGITIAPVTVFVRDTTTSERGADRIRDLLMDQVREDNGGILILHDRLFRLEEDARECPGHRSDRRWVANAVDHMISELRAEGYTFLRLDRVRIPPG